MKIQEKINELINKHILNYATHPNRIIIDIDNLDKLKKELGVRNTETLTEYMGCKVFVWFEDNTIEVFKKEMFK
jgi:hypothetical protein